VFANAFGQRVGYDPAKTGAAAELELKTIVRQIAGLRRDKEKKIRRTLLDLFAEVQGQAQSISRHLGRIRFGNVTLAEPWRLAQEGLSRLWREKSEELTCFRFDELSRLRMFLEGHPEYPKVVAEEQGTIESLFAQGQLSIDDLIKITWTEMLESVKKLSA
jgi:hypothetical protein